MVGHRRAKTPRVELCEGALGWWFVIRWANGNVAALSEIYQTYVVALRQAQLMARLIPTARLVNLTLVDE
jgi:hypothetical protein